jgi:hypothetical protein
MSSDDLAKSPPHLRFIKWSANQQTRQVQVNGAIPIVGAVKEQPGLEHSERIGVGDAGGNLLAVRRRQEIKRFSGPTLRRSLGGYANMRRERVDGPALKELLQAEV